MSGQGRRSGRYYDPGRQPQPRRAPEPPRLDGAAWARADEERERLAERNATAPLTRQQRRKAERESKARHPHGVGDLLG